VTGIVLIPKLTDWQLPGPGWIPTRRLDDSGWMKPRIKCQCGKVVHIGLHHVHADGIVTRSFFHSQASDFSEGGKSYRHEPGCGWHVWIKLQDYECGDFPPVP
jgi:hypothetical protein